MAHLMRPRIRAAVAGAAVALLAVTACSSGGEGAPEAEKSSSPSPGADPTSTAEPEPEPLVLGTQRYRNPCRLLSADDVRRTYGPLGPYASYDQEARERGLSTATMKDIAGTIAGAVDDKCSYSLDNKRKTTLYVEVAQHPSAAEARASWKRTRRLGTGKDSRQLSQESAEQWLIDLARQNEADLGGVPVPGMDDSVLYVKHFGQFVGHHDNIVLKVSRKDYISDDPFEPRSVRGDLRRMRQVFDTLYARIDEPDLDQAPAPAYWAQSPGWPTFADPCRVFDDETMELATGHRSYRGEFLSHSAFLSPPARQRRNSSPAFQAVSNTCERTDRVPGRRGRPSRLWTLRGEVWYAAPGTTGRQLLEGLPIRKLYGPDDQGKYGIEDLVKAKVLRPVEVPGAEAAYLFDYTRKGLGRIGWLMASSGDRLVHVDAEQPARKRPGALLTSDPVPEAKMVAAAARALEGLEAQAD